MHIIIRGRDGTIICRNVRSPKAQAVFSKFFSMTPKERKNTPEEAYIKSYIYRVAKLSGMNNPCSIVFRRENAFHSH